MSSLHRVLDPKHAFRVAPGQCALAIMTKAPRAGAVKTRLQPPLTAEEAAGLNICFLRDLAAAITSGRESENASVGVAVFTPAGAEADYEMILPPDFCLLIQRGDDFGARLTNAVEDLLQLGFSSCCLINSDSPTVPVENFRAATAQLQRDGDRVVLGPSDDGGYYLIGLKKLHRTLFQEIDWSSERVLDQTLTQAKKIGLPVHLLPNGFDVDDRATLRRLAQELLDTDNESVAPATAQFLRDLVARDGRARIAE